MPATAILVLLLVHVSGQPRALQCPNGAPPPCGSSQDSLGALAVRRAAATDLRAAAQLLSHRGDTAAAADSMCRAVAVLPESLRAWRAPSDCIVAAVRSRALLSPGMLDTLVSILRPEGSGPWNAWPVRLSGRVRLFHLEASGGRAPALITFLFVDGALKRVSVRSAAGAYRVALLEGLGRILGRMPTIIGGS